MSKDKGWFCFVCVSHIKRSEDEIISSMSSVVGSDLHEVHIVGFGEDCDDIYVLANISGISDYIQELSSGSLKFKGIPDAHSPQRLTPEEVDAYLQSSVKKVDDLSKMDVVVVCSGYLKGLFGIVVDGPTECGSYDVLFKFHTRRFLETINGEDLEILNTLSVVS